MSNSLGKNQDPCIINITDSVPQINWMDINGLNVKPKISKSHKKNIFYNLGVSTDIPSTLQT
jgi:hypothetical protein